MNDTLTNGGVQGIAWPGFSVYIPGLLGTQAEPSGTCDMCGVHNRLTL